MKAMSFKWHKVRTCDDRTRKVLHTCANCTHTLRFARKQGRENLPPSWAATATKTPLFLLFCSFARRQAFTHCETVNRRWNLKLVSLFMGTCPRKKSGRTETWARFRRTFSCFLRKQTTLNRYRQGQQYQIILAAYLTVKSHRICNRHSKWNTLLLANLSAITVMQYQRARDLTQVLEKQIENFGNAS